MKPRVLCFTLIFASLLIFVPAGCKKGPASLVGTYSMDENGKMKEFIRVERTGDTYNIFEKDGTKWLSPGEVATVGDQEVTDILGTPVTGISTGVGNRQVAVLQVPPGWKLGTFECETGFWLASALGPIELHKN
jgi:hypothetical protein